MQTIVERIPVALVIGGTLALTACGGGGDDTKSSQDPKVVAEAQQVWDNRCANCHGPQGMGNGPAAAGLSVKPRSFTNAKWQQSVTDEHIKKIIIGGGAAVGLNAQMAANPDLADKPEVVEQLVYMVRSFG